MHEKPFQKVKRTLCKTTVLELQDVKKNIVSNCVAPEYGISCVLGHIIESKERPKTYAPRAAHKMERNYTMINNNAAKPNQLKFL